MVNLCRRKPNICLYSDPLFGTRAVVHLSIFRSRVILRTNVKKFEQEAVRGIVTIASSWFLRASTWDALKYLCINENNVANVVYITLHLEDINAYM